jgi:Protein of unknown function (DUF3828)
MNAVTRRRFVSTFISATALASLPPLGAGAADPDPKAFLEAIYAAYRGKNSKGVLLDTDAQVKRYFDPKLAGLIIQDRRKAARRKEVPDLDGDPFVNAQDWEIKSVAIEMHDVGPAKAGATVKLDNAGTMSTVDYDLVRLPEGWRIAGITWDGKDTLRGLLGGK